MSIMCPLYACICGFIDRPNKNQYTQTSNSSNSQHTTFESVYVSKPAGVKAVPVSKRGEVADPELWRDVKEILKLFKPKLLISSLHICSTLPM